jgi:hypothetical protein
MEADEAITLEVSQIRAYLDGDIEFIKDLDTALDNAQGHVFSGQAGKATILITIVSDMSNGEAA